MQNRWADPDAAAIPVANTQALLFNRTMGVLCGMNVITYVGSRMTADWTPTTGGMIGLLVVSLGLILGTSIWARMVEEDDPTPLLGVGLFALVEGMTIGPALTMYANTLGPQYVSYACAIVVAATGVFGLIGSTLTFAYAKVEAVLVMGLLGLLVFLFGLLVIAPPPGINLVVSLGAAALFCGFLVVDFARLKDVGRYTAGWGAAGLLAMSIYLDMINLLLWVLRIMSSKKD